MAANSPLVLGFPESYCNAVDPGRMLYGVIEDAEHPLASRIASIFKAFKTTLGAVRDVLPRERFAELAPFPVREPVRLGVLPIGLAEGFLSLNAGRVLIRGASVPILARPTLEHTRVDLTRVPEAQTGDEVVLIGRQGQEEIALTEVAARHGLGTYEMALAIRGRTARTYVSGQETAAPR